MEEYVAGSNHHSEYNRSLTSTQISNEPMTLMRLNGPLVLMNIAAVPYPPFTIAPHKNMKRTSKRKHDRIDKYRSPYVESYLIQLCRRNKWVEVVHRCRYYPEEARLVPFSANDVLVKDSSFFHENYKKRASISEYENGSVPLFHESALGILCASSDLGTKEAKVAFLALIHANPSQIGASQCVPGHTPLRDASLNDRCTVDIFRILIHTALVFPNGYIALYQKDRNGLSLIDHLVTSIQLGSSLNSVAMLKEFIWAVRQSSFGNIVLSSQDHASPLIRLLTMGNAFFRQGRPVNESDNDDLRLQRVLHATRLLLDDNPKLLYRLSNVTKCTPLHVALRNYGCFVPLIEELLKRDTTSEMVKTRNNYGDLPIHVASSIGVPFHVFNMLIETAVSVQQDQINFEPNMWIWSTNNSGYSPVDLEWICHIESGLGLYTARMVCAREIVGSRDLSLKQDSYYKDVMIESVNEIIKCTLDDSKCAPDKRKEEAEMIFGDLLDRISLLIRAAVASGKMSFVKDANRYAKLHEVCKLSTIYAPSLPLPMLELFLWLYSEEIIEKDSHNFLPIHYTLSCGATAFHDKSSTTTHLSRTAVEDWKSFVFNLLEKSTEQCRVKSRESRLPLHYVLDHSAASGCHNAPTSNISPSTKIALQLARHAVVEKLIDLYPESVDKKDPITGLYPYMMASIDTGLSIDTVFSLLRRSPSRCLPAVKDIDE